MSTITIETSSRQCDSLFPKISSLNIVVLSDRTNTDVWILIVKSLSKSSCCCCWLLENVWENVVLSLKTDIKTLCRAVIGFQLQGKQNNSLSLEDFLSFFLFCCLIKQHYSFWKEFFQSFELRQCTFILNSQRRL